MDFLKRDKYIFTFGVGTENYNKCVEIEGTGSEARDLMFEAFGSKWAFQYDSKKGAELIRRFGYTKMELPLSGSERQVLTDIESAAAKIHKASVKGSS